MQYSVINRQPDGRARLLHFTGGFRARRLPDDLWEIEPIFIHGKPCRGGPLTKSQLLTISKENNFKPIAFQDLGWLDGVYQSTWNPIVPGEKNHIHCPADIWSHIAGNIARGRVKDFFEAGTHHSELDIAKTFDNRRPVEAIALHISLSLQNMDISFEQISDHYHEQLVNHLTAGQINGEKCKNTMSQTLCAHVQSFFLHLVAARDYLCALVAYRIGFDHSECDSMERLKKKLRQSELKQDSLLDILFSEGYLTADPRNPDKFIVSGWMKEATSNRNELVHKRSYGSKFDESFGWIVATQNNSGLYRYYRAINLSGCAETDVFDLLHHHYSICNKLMIQAATASGLDVEMMSITASDIISAEIKGHVAAMS
jgi:hypothetical protein